MDFKTLPAQDAARIAAIPLDYDWDTTIGNGFIAASDESHPRLADALERLGIHGAADLVMGATEWGLARVQQHLDMTDARLRLQAAWAATVDVRYASMPDADDLPGTPPPAWSEPEWQLRDRLASLCNKLQRGLCAKTRQQALGTILLAEHLCGRDPAFDAWLTGMLRAKIASSPRDADDHDYTFRDTRPATPEQLTSPSREERLSGLDPHTNPYLRSAADMAGLGFVGEPYPATR